MNGISFPGLGIKEFMLDPVAFTVFGRDVMWYGVIITFAIICAFSLGNMRAKHEKVDGDTYFDLTFITVILSIIGARLYFVIFHGGFAVKEGTFFEKLWGTLYNVIAIWEGGLAIYGAIIVGAVTIALYGKIKHVNIAKLLDATAPGVLLGQAIGRWGNFTNAEAHGGVTDIFCRMGIRYGGYGEMEYYHPTFLYESLWNIAGVILLTALYKKKKFNGHIVLGYFCWYGFGRMFIEGLRTDSLYIGSTGIRVSQLLGFLLFAASGILMIVGSKLASRVPALSLDAPSGCEERFEKELKENAKRAEIRKERLEALKNVGKKKKIIKGKSEEKSEEQNDEDN
ncbi:MAG: prolipoprotein diacylglyceryl transferase [Ruminococcaceae bacterium]|nr:prolipoprotein diacylglyceryl transferase [Oscillospiraceae bacterium]